MKTVVIIPARGGSKGIPRKNLRPLGGKPLIYYSIKAAIECAAVDAVYVSTDDGEIALFAERFGAQVLMRPPELGGDAVTLDPVIVDAVETLERRGARFDVVITVQPTSPLIASADLRSAVAMFAGDPALDTVLSAVDDRHLRWRSEGGRVVPDYQMRVNRQALPACFRETGAVIACRRNVLDGGSRIGTSVRLLEIEPWRSVDIDSISDFFQCEGMLRRRRILFTVIGRPEIGMGHVYRTLMIANELVNHNVMFLCEEGEHLAVEHVRRHNYPLTVCAKGELLDAVVAAKPDLVVNDILDTDANYVAGLKKAGLRVVNFEDLGLGAEMADLVINALYPHQIPRDNILVGPAYFCLRDEFLHLRARDSRGGEVRRVLLTFGGVDEGNLTCRVLSAAGPVLVERGISIDIIVGPGYGHRAELDGCLARIGSPRIRLVGATERISEFMQACDVAVTSGGRTVLELAALRVPTIVICQNARELTHRFASAENGVLNLGLHTAHSGDAVRDALCRVVDDPSVRATMTARAGAVDLRSGKQRVVSAMLALVDHNDGEGSRA